mmetsp:Transcript_45273/g.92412  ORF Transcript_45273/g.92412 Transcript_45273/m.92412 type:complete len:208 (+) Transcript_45273:105-728(+)
MLDRVEPRHSGDERALGVGEKLGDVEEEEGREEGGAEVGLPRQHHRGHAEEHPDEVGAEEEAAADSAGGSEAQEHAARRRRRHRRHRHHLRPRQRSSLSSKMEEPRCLQLLQDHRQQEALSGGTTEEPGKLAPLQPLLQHLRLIEGVGGVDGGGEEDEVAAGDEVKLHQRCCCPHPHHRAASEIEVGFTDAAAGSLGPRGRLAADHW